MANLDIVFSTGWEEKYPLSLSWCLTRVGSDHSPIVVDDGESLAVCPRYFFFDQQWFLVEVFKDMVGEIWKESEAKCPDTCYFLDSWHGCMVWLRTKLKGWNINRLGSEKKKKKELMGELYSVDLQAKFITSRMGDMYQIEKKLGEIYIEEELYWRQRIGKHWLMAGDSNTKFFHWYANGRRRKSTIIQLETNQGTVSSQEDLTSHAVNFYKNLFRLVEPRGGLPFLKFLGQQRYSN